MDYNPIRAIDQWYMVGQRDEVLDEYLQQHREEFWENLSFLDIINIIPRTKLVAHTAYYFNYANFRDFCRQAWESDTIDYRQLPDMKIEQFRQIQGMFTAKTVIFSAKMPQNILSYINRGENITFYTSGSQYGGLPLTRPITHSYLEINLTIKGNYNYNLTDPTIEILYTFQNIKKLTLNTTYINKEKLAVLDVNNFKSIILENCALEDKKDSRLTQLILAQGRQLETIEIGFKGHNRNMSKVIKSLIQNIQVINIKELRISIKTNNNIAKLLIQNLKKSKTLKFLTIYKITDERNIRDEEFLKELNKLENIKTDIQIYTCDTPQLENRHWYR